MSLFYFLSKKPDKAEIKLTGYILVGFKISGYEAGLKIRKQIIIRIDKTDGRVYFTEVKSL